jgi:cytochrome b561
MTVRSAFAAERYDRVARLFHWTIAVLVILNIFGGLFHDALEGIAVMPFHKATGITVLVLTLARIGWRLGHAVPPAPTDIPRWEQIAARTNHLIFYALMLLMPLTGWIMSSAGNRPLTWYGLFDIPKFAVTREDAITGISGGGHMVMGYLFAALVVLHIAAALRHHFALKDGVLRRMV